MAPAAGSRGAPPEDGVYRRSPVLKQARLPRPRMTVRVNGKPKRERMVLRQQTLTQINFVPGGSDNPVVLSDSDADIAGGEGGGSDQRGSVEAGNAKARSGHVQDDSEDDEPRSSATRRTRLSVERRRRRSASTDGADRSTKKNKEEANKKRKMAIPTRCVSRPASGQTPSSSHHTQTLTQGYLDWLGASGRSGADARDSDREGSVIPQTPPRVETASPSATTRSTAKDHGSGNSDWQRPSKRAASPSEGSSKKRSLEDARQSAQCTRSPDVGDPFGMDSLSSEISMSRQSGLRSQSPDFQDGSCLTIQSTPEAVPHGKDPSLDDLPRTMRRVGFADENLVEVFTEKVSGSGSSAMPIEIPDSEEEGDDDFDHGYDGSGLVASMDNGQHEEEAFPAGVETQRVLEELAFNDHQLPAHDVTLADPTTPSARRVLFSSPLTTRAQITDQVRDLTSLRPPPPVGRRKPLHKANDKRVLRRPVVPCAHESSQIAESQRVAIHILQALPPASARSDIILPVQPDSLESILHGYEVQLCMPFRIPNQVVRFWLFDGARLRYMACAQPAQACQSDWTYGIDQIYELNNPVTDEDMREEGWVRGQIKRYVYLPPAIVGQLLWNLKHAIFDGDDDDDKDNTNLSEQCQAQIGEFSSPVRSQVNPHHPRMSTLEPLPHIPQHTRHPAQDRDPAPSQPSASITQTAKDRKTLPDPKLSPPSFKRPHSDPPSDLPQLTTTISTTTREPPASLSPEAQPPSSQQVPQSSISSSIVFQDHGEATVVAPAGIHLSPSQLLTKSQMLPDTLIRDVPGFPHVIWDSEDDVEL